jgi:hypothetical protein
MGISGRIPYLPLAFFEKVRYKTGMPMKRRNTKGLHKTEHRVMRDEKRA